jgi:hypothetical protein
MEHGTIRDFNYKNVLKGLLWFFLGFFALFGLIITGTIVVGIIDTDRKITDSQQLAKSEAKEVCSNILPDKNLEIKNQSAFVNIIDTNTTIAKTETKVMINRSFMTKSGQYYGNVTVLQVLFDGLLISKTNSPAEDYIKISFSDLPEEVVEQFSRQITLAKIQKEKDDKTAAALRLQQEQALNEQLNALRKAAEEQASKDRQAAEEQIEQDKLAAEEQRRKWKTQALELTEWAIIIKNKTKSDVKNMLGTPFDAVDVDLRITYDCNVLGERFIRDSGPRLATKWSYLNRVVDKESGVKKSLCVFFKQEENGLALYITDGNRKRYTQDKILW